MACNQVYDQILLFGDSLTQMSYDRELAGLASGLANAYVRKMDVVNRGFSGFNTDWAMPILKQLLPTTEDQAKQKASIRLMTIFFGANDAALPGSVQHVPLERYKANIKEMIDTIKNPQSPFYNPNVRVILITPPPLCESLWKKRCDELGDPLNRTNENTRGYAEVLKQIGQESNIPVADLWTAIMNLSEQSKEGLSHFLTDGLHLNTKGYEVLYNLILQIISTRYPEIHPDALNYDIPYWRDIKKESYEQQLIFSLLK